MRAKDLKAELDSRGVGWRGVAFEKEELCRLVEAARLAPPPPPTAPPPAAPPPPPATAASPPAPEATTRDPAPPASGAVSDERSAVAGMRVPAIKAELAALGVDASTMFEKVDFVEALLKARLMKKAERPPRGAAKDFEYGAQSRQGEGGGMEDAFKAAGWTGEEERDPYNVDTARSPGLRRNFADVGRDDFRKPWTGAR